MPGQPKPDINDPLEENQTPEVYAVRWEHGKARITRRDLLKAGGVLAAGVVVAGCTPEKTEQRVSTITPTKKTIGPTRTLTPTATPEPTQEILDWNCEGAKAHDSQITRILFPEASQSMISFCNDETIFKVWSFPDGRKCDIIDAHDDLIRSLAICPTGEFIYSADKSGKVIVWSFPEMEQINSFQVDNVKTSYPMLYLSPDGTLLAIRGDSGSVSFWRVPRCELITEILHPDVSYLSCEFSPDGKYVSTVAYSESEVIVWVLPEGEMLKKFDSNEMFIFPKFTEDSQYFTFPQDQLVEIYSLPEGELANTLTGHAAKIVDQVYCAATQQLITGDVDGVIKAWSLPAGEEINSRVSNTISYFSVNEEAKILAAVDSESKMITLWSLPDFKVLMDISYETDTAYPEFSADGRFIHLNKSNTGAEERIIQVYSLDTFKMITEIAVMGYVIVVYNPDSRYLVIGDETGVIKLYSLVDGQEIACMVDLTASTESVEGIEYTVSESGQTVTYTMPCGSPIPAGAVCVCNCVAGSGCACVGHTTCSCVGHTTCSCVGYSPCSCVSHSSGCSAVYHYWYPN